MAQRTILIVGTSFHTLPAYLDYHGFHHITLKDVRLLKGRPLAPGHIACDFSSPATMREAADQAAARFPIDGVMTTYEKYVLPTAYIAAHLGTPALPLDAARACTDKSLMRSKFATAPEPISPDFALVDSEADLRAFARAHAFPLILKPAHLSKSLLVFKNNSLDELLANYKHMLEAIPEVHARHAPHTTPKIIVEEFMQGPVHSVDAFVDGEGVPHVLEQVVDYQTGHDIGYADNFHYSRILPSRLSPSEIADIRRVAELGCRSLGMRNSPAHIEVIRTADGPRIVEIGARNGGYRERMHRLGNGIDITGNAIRTILGEPLDIQATKSDHVGVFELFPKTPGIFTGITHEAELRELPSLHTCTIKAAPGGFIGSSSDGYKMAAIVIMHHADAKQFEHDVRYLDTHVAVQTTPTA